MIVGKASNKIERVLKKRLPLDLSSEEGIQRWFEPINQRIQIVAQEVYDTVKEVLAEEEKRLHDSEECERIIFQYFLGNDSLTKSVPSIRSKIVRELKERKRFASKLGVLSHGAVERLILSFPDLGRFRIICGLSSDVTRALEVLLGEERKNLCNQYPLVGPVKDYVYDLSKRHPAKGHRARQFTVKASTGKGKKIVQVEIQLMTMVQHAWDQRNHPLYECMREGRELPDKLVISDVALAETLYLVDEQAARNWEDFLQHTRRCS